jgi:2'-5' RNA ligase
MPRLFTGIALPENIADDLAALHQPLPGARWVDPDNYHITLRFAGDVDGAVAREFALMLAEIEIDAFEVRLEGLSTFGNKEPTSLWAGVTPHPGLEALARANERAARAAGLAPERRAFRAHVTIARLRGTPPEIIARYLGRIGAFRTEPFGVSEFHLYSSRPKVGGGPYIAEETYALRGAWLDTDDDDTRERWR